MKCKPDTRLVILEEASHFMTMEHPEIAQAEIESVVDRVRSELR
jgi:pimeloyl-ACP methyl ester carboxylesterase